MDDAGFTLTGLAISGTALTAIGGVVGAWIRARYNTTTIKPQPLTVREEKGPVPRELDDERHKKLDGQVDLLFASMHQQRTTAGKVEAIEKQVESMDRKLDTIITQLAKRRT